jgi:putative transposase
LRYILFFINIKTRQVHIAGIAKNPTQNWVHNQVQQIIPLLTKDKHGKIILFRDRDSKYPKRLDRLLRQSGISVKILPRCSPNLNAYAESWVNRIRDDCLNYFVVFGESHLRYLTKNT